NGIITLVIPYSTIEPIKQKLQSGFQVESDQTDKKLWSTTIIEQLLGTEVEIKVDLGETNVSMGELLQMKVGDVVSLNQDATGEFDVQIEGIRKFKSYYGIHHGSVAVQITRPSDLRGKV